MRTRDTHGTTTASADCCRHDTVSLDVEGAELAVLKSIDFTRVSIGLFVIEHNKQAKAIHEFLTSKGYRQVTQIQGDTDAKWKSSDVMYILESECPSHVQ